MVKRPDPLSPERLRTRCPRSYFPSSSTRQIRPLTTTVGQKRALEALRVGLSMESAGYNIFATGLPGSGRTSTAAALVRKLRRRYRRQLDYAFVNNWDDPDRPVLLSLPRGEGGRLRRDMDRLVKGLRRVLPRAVQAGRLAQRSDRVSARFQEAEKRLLERFDRRVRRYGFELTRRPGEEGDLFDLELIVGDRSFPMDRLDALVRRGKLKRADAAMARPRYEALRGELEGVIRRSRNLEARMSREIGRLEEKEVARILEERFARLRQRHREPRVRAYLRGAQRSMLREVELFIQEPEKGVGRVAGGEGRPGADPFAVYRVNVIQEGGRRPPLPVVETNPNYRNLFGAIERLERPGGAVYVDFNTIRAGSLLRADGGVLIVNAQDLLEEPGVFRALKRVLRSGELEIQDPDSAASYAPVALKPEAIPIDVKVILVGEESLHEMLWDQEELHKLFKIKAEFDDTMRFNRRNARAYGAFVARVCAEEGLPPLNRDALCTLVDEGRRRTGRSGFLTTRLWQVADLVREAAQIAQGQGKRTVQARHVEAAVRAQERRQSLLEEKVQREIRSGQLKIDTSGRRVGAANSLVVYEAGSYRFGRPSRVTASVAPGTHGIVNIEREVALSDGSYDKGVLILGGYLRQALARDLPLSLSASLCMEQSYGGVDGDSATLAEGLALLSALSGVPLNQAVAVTGALDQAGHVMAVGGVTEKVDGFFAVVRERGLRHTATVVIPASNVSDLMISEEAVAAARERKLSVVPVEKLEDALAVAADPVPPGEVLAKARERIERFGEALRRRGGVA